MTSTLPDWCIKPATETSGWARVLADSLNPWGTRITSLEVLMWREMLAEFNTHRVFGRNSASSRAIPVQTMLRRVLDDPFIPRRIPINQPGMSATEYIEQGQLGWDEAVAIWLLARDNAVESVRRLLELKVHKQLANRLLEPFMRHTVVVTATEWTNFFELRISEFAQPEICDVAIAMKEAMDASTPVQLESGDWHLPFIGEGDEELSPGEKIQASTARAAATSYNRHTDKDFAKEQVRFAGLKTNRHMSPFEHPAEAVDSRDMFFDHLRGFRSARWFLDRGRELPA